MRGTVGAEKVSDAVLLAARVLLVLVFVIFGWKKLIGFGGTVAYFSHSGVPLPFPSTSSSPQTWTASLSK